ncbi:MAG: hypothetical protein ACJA0P_004078 [Planctomycetota bacterium]|jgi:hypothetical protein
MESEFVIMKVNMSNENKNEEFLGHYPSVPAYPHLFVLDSSGTFLHSQGTGELEEGKGYEEAMFVAFLDKWKAEG